MAHLDVRSLDVAARVLRVSFRGVPGPGGVGTVDRGEVLCASDDSEAFVVVF